MAFFLLPWLPEWLLTRGGGRPLVRDLKRQSPNLADDLLETMRRNVIQPGAATAMLAYYRANILRIAKEAPGMPTIACPTRMKNDSSVARKMSPGCGA